MTLAKVKKEYIVYMHKNKINGKVYVGITKQKPKNRWNYGNGYLNSGHFIKAIRKYGWNNFEHIILYEKLTLFEAEQKEIELIAKYKSNNQKYGYNIENGGHCNIMTEETKDKIRKKAIGRKMSDEFKEKCRINNIGRKATEETKNKMSKSQLGKHGIKTNQYDLEGNFIKTWNSAREASKYYNIDEGNITQCCRKRSKSCNGFIWRYYNDKEKIKKYFIKKTTKKVVCINNNVIYNSIKEASEKLNVSRNKISLICNNHKKYKSVKGLRFKFYEEQNN